MRINLVRFLRRGAKYPSPRKIAPYGDKKAQRRTKTVQLAAQLARSNDLQGSTNDLFSTICFYLLL